MLACNLLAQFASLRSARKLTTCNLGQETNLKATGYRLSLIGRFNYPDVQENRRLYRKRD
jgi:hypothetical protein